MSEGPELCPADRGARSADGAVSHTTSCRQNRSSNRRISSPPTGTPTFSCGGGFLIRRGRSRPKAKSGACYAGALDLTRNTLPTKCHLCRDRIDAGAQPACVAACPTEALQFGRPEKGRIDPKGRWESIPGFFDPASCTPNLFFARSFSVAGFPDRVNSWPERHKGSPGRK